MRSQELAVLLLVLLILSLPVAAIAYLVHLARSLKRLDQRMREMEILVAGLRPPSTKPGVQPTTPPPIPPQPEVEKPKPPARPERNLEALIGGNWLNRIGVVAFLFGVAFFLKYAFDNRWIGETGRVILGLLAGIAFLALGERYQRKGYARFGQGITGGGIGLLYLSIFAAFNFYHLIPQPAAFAFMIVVTATGIALAVRYDALPIASLGTLGGFITPFLLSTGTDNQVALFSYIFLLNLGVLTVAYFRNWRALNYQSFALTVIVFLTWAERFYEPAKLWKTAFFLTLLFLVFALLAIFHNIIHRRKATAPELTLAFLNAAVYFGAMYSLLDDKYHAYLGLFALAMSAAYVGFAYLTNTRISEDRFLVWIFLGLGATFATLAIPIQLKQNWITVGWAIEGAVLVYIGFSYDSRNTKLAALALLALVFTRLMFFDLSLPYRTMREEFTLIFNRRVFSFVMGIASMLFGAYHFSREREKTVREVATGVLLAAPNVAAIALLSLEARDYLLHLYYRELVSARVLQYGQQMSLSIIWTVYAAFLIAVGIWKNRRLLRYMALALFGITIVKVFFFDLAELERFYRIISFVALGLILIGVSFLYQKYRAVLIGPAPAKEETT
ncbi:MAG: hypothetical protein Kow0099_38990 [Candidatus Abyssubacteria bacterium]